jgi:ubiquinone/menaquinone biosynthesis C-methylase UbiE
MECSTLKLKIWFVYCWLRAQYASHVFHKAAQTPIYLGLEELHHLQTSYPPMSTDYSYTPASLRRRGQERANHLRELLAEQWSQANFFLDLGSWDSMTCAALQSMGKTTIGLDIRSEGFTVETRQKQVSFLQMDAAQIGLADDSIDCVFSFNSFEHFADPTAVFQEIMRILRPGGHIYLDFGPLYWSAKGAHQFKTIHIPYVQCLFSQEMLTQYGQIHKIDLVEFFWMNEWSMNQYRSLWQKYAPQLETVIYNEIIDPTYVDLIYQYPSCFRSKSTQFDNFLIAYIKALFRKKP